MLRAPIVLRHGTFTWEVVSLLFYLTLLSQPSVTYLKSNPFCPPSLLFVLATAYYRASISPSFISVQKETICPQLLPDKGHLSATETILFLFKHPKGFALHQVNPLNPSNKINCYLFPLNKNDHTNIRLIVP